MAIHAASCGGIHADAFAAAFAAGFAAFAAFAAAGFFWAPAAGSLAMVAALFPAALGFAAGT
eukprot:5960202-Amphidinium_carterae.1